MIVFIFIVLWSLNFYCEVLDLLKGYVFRFFVFSFYFLTKKLIRTILYNINKDGVIGRVYIKVN